MGRSLYLVLSVALAAVPASAQSVDAIVAKNLQAKGGVELLRSTNTVKMTGTFKSFQPSERTASTTSYAKRPDLRRQETELPSLPTSATAAPSKPLRMVFATDGRTSWMQQGLAKPQSMPAAQAATLPQDTEFDSVFIDYQSKGVIIKSLGVEKLGGRDVHHLTVTRKTGPVQHYYLDAETGLEAKVVTEVSQGGAMSQGGQTAKVETEMSDYRTVDGRTVPFRMRQSVNGQVAAEMTIDTVAFNVEMPDSLFTLPK